MHRASVTRCSIHVSNGSLPDRFVLLLQIYRNEAIRNSWYDGRMTERTRKRSARKMYRVSVTRCNTHVFRNPHETDLSCNYRSVEWRLRETIHGTIRGRVHGRMAWWKRKIDVEEIVSSVVHSFRTSSSLDRFVLLLQICQRTSWSKHLGRFEDEDMRARSRVLHSMQYPCFDDRSRRKICNAGV